MNQQPTRAQRMKAIDHERNVASQSISKLKQTFFHWNGLWKNHKARIAVESLEELVAELDGVRATIVASCDTEGHELAPGEAGYTSICMVCGKTFDAENGDA